MPDNSPCRAVCGVIPPSGWCANAAPADIRIMAAAERKMRVIGSPPRNLFVTKLADFRGKGREPHKQRALHGSPRPLLLALKAGLLACGHDPAAFPDLVRPSGNGRATNLQSRGRLWHRAVIFHPHHIPSLRHGALLHSHLQCTAIMG